MDLALTAGIYARIVGGSRRIALHQTLQKYTGNLNAQFSSIRTGEKGEPDSSNKNTFRLQWTHSQDPKANPGSTFSASVNFATSGYLQIRGHDCSTTFSDADQLDDLLLKNWGGTPFSLSMNMAVSQNSQNSHDLDDAAQHRFSTSRFYPSNGAGRRANTVVREISMQYTGKMTNTVSTLTGVGEVFTSNRRSKHAQRHPSTPRYPGHGLVQTSSTTSQRLAVVSNYTGEVVFQKKQEREWSPRDQRSALPRSQKTQFYRLYNSPPPVSALDDASLRHVSQFKRKDQQDTGDPAHSLPQSFGFSYAPTSRIRNTAYYKPYRPTPPARVKSIRPSPNNAYGVPSSGRSMSMNFSLSQTLSEGALQARHVGHQEDQAIDNLSVCSASY